MDKKKVNVKGNLYALISVVVWGTAFLVSKELLDFLSPIELMIMRLLIAYFTLFIIYPKWFFNLKDELILIVLALFGNTLYFLGQNFSLKYTSASNVSILVSTSPILSLVIIYFLDKSEKINRKQKIGLLIAFIGVILVVFNGVVNLKLNPLGDFLALLSSLLWAIYSILLKDKLRDVNNFIITRKIMLYGFLTSLPLLIFNENTLKLKSLLSMNVLFCLLYLSIISSAFCFLFWNDAVKMIGVVKTNMYLYLIPMVTLIAEVIFLKGKVTIMGLSGIVLVLLGMYFSNLKEN